MAVAVNGRSQSTSSHVDHSSVSAETGRAWQVLRQSSTTASPEQTKPPLPAQQHSPPPPPQVFVATQDRPIVRPTRADAAPDRVTLTRALQRELKRVGCYHGEITGVWSPATRHASEAFLALANAKLPVAEPDAVLLALVQASQTTSCLAPCAQGRGVNGTCRETVVAGAPSVDKSGTANSPAAPPPTGFEAPMGLNGPQAPEGEKGVLPPPADQRTPAARPPQRRNAAHAPREDWRAKIWRNTGN